MLGRRVRIWPSAVLGYQLTGDVGAARNRDIECSVQLDTDF